jgi:hypothetical protein
VWWTWTAPANGRVTINTVGSVFDTLLAVYTGQSLGALASVASDDQSGGNNTSRVVFQVVAGTTYQIAVDGYNGATGQVELTLDQAAEGGIYETDFEIFPSGSNALGGNVGSRPTVSASAALLSSRLNNRALNTDPPRMPT